MIRRFALLLSFVALATSATAQRLPKTVIPEHYQLAFTIDLANAKFTGQTGIDVRVTQSTSTITLHAVDMNITSATVAAGGQTQTATVAMNAAAQTATLTVPKAVAAGKARIAIDYNAALNSSLRGLYLSKANNRSYAVTQFESTDARRAFPCFDEPAFKATYAVTVTADRGDIAISNGRMREGHFERHVRQMRAIYQARRELFVKLLKRDCAGLVDVEAPDAGMNLIAWLPAHGPAANDKRMCQALAQAGIDALPLSDCVMERKLRPGLLLGFSGIREPDIREGVQKLRRVLEAQANRR